MYMNSVAEIEAAIEKLTPEEEQKLREWLLRRASSELNDDLLVPPQYRQTVLNAIEGP